MRVYCEHGALSLAIKELVHAGVIECLHFPYDADSYARGPVQMARPSAAKIQDLNLPVKDLPGAAEDYNHSELFEQIRLIIGLQHWKDALHIDSAYKSGCVAFVTSDHKHILKHSSRLEQLLGIKFYAPNTCFGYLQVIYGLRGIPGYRLQRWF
jgi:hypothetical protein